MCDDQGAIFQYIEKQKDFVQYNQLLATRIAEAVGLVGFVTDEDAEVLEGAEDAEDGGFGDAGTDDGFAEGEGSGARNLFEKAEGALEDRDQVTGLGGGGSGFHSDEGKYGILRRRSRGSIEKRAFLIRNS